MAVSRQLKKRIDEYRKKYAEDEYLVMEITKDTFGGNVNKSSNDEDRLMHVDFWWDTPKGMHLGVDVKGVKKNSNGELDDTCTWLELKNNYGYPGWLYGKEDYIAFKTYTKIVYIRREVLCKYAEEMSKGKEVVYRTPKDYYVPYQRKPWGRKDITIKVPMSDIIDLVNQEGQNNGFFAEY